MSVPHPDSRRDHGRARSGPIRPARIVVGLAAIAVFATTALSVSGGDTISTVAGSGTQGFSGNGGPAISAELADPADVVVDVAGNRYIAEIQNHVVRRVDPAGTITTFAGTGNVGNTGDGGPATSADLTGPVGLALDGLGNLFISDFAANVVRKVNPAGVITTVVGTGNGSFSGDGGPATSAELNQPYQVTFGGGNLFVADTGNNRIRKVDAGGVITTVAGTGTQGFSGDGGPGVSAELNSPFGVRFDGGNLYVADGFNSRVRRVDPGGTITTVVGTGVAGTAGDGGPATSAELTLPVRVGIDGAGNLYVSDYLASRVRRVSAIGTITTLAGTGTPGFSGDGGPASAAQLNGPTGLAFTANASLLVAEIDNDRVRQIANVVPTASFTATPARGMEPLGVAFDGAASSDPNGSITSFAWDFGDGANGTGASAAHTYAVDGSYVAKLTVRDDSGAAATASRTIIVTPAPPACTIVGTAGDDVLVGTPRNDVICGLGGDDLLIGRAGRDRLLGGRGNDRLIGGTGDDILVGGPAGDRLSGGTGRDTLHGGTGSDVLAGGAGADSLFGDRGGDELLGGSEGDLLGARDGMRDRLNGGAGPDVANVDRGLDVVIGVEATRPSRP